MAGDVTRLAEESANAAEFESGLLELLQRSVGFDVAFFSVKGAQASPTVVGIESSLIEKAVRGGPRYYRDLLPVKQAALKGRGVAVDTRVLGERRVRKTAFPDGVRVLAGPHDRSDDAWTLWLGVFGP